MIFISCDKNTIKKKVHEYEVMKLKQLDALLSNANVGNDE